MAQRVNGAGIFGIAQGADAALGAILGAGGGGSGGPFTELMDLRVNGQRFHRVAVGADAGGKTGLEAGGFLGDCPIAEVVTGGFNDLGLHGVADRADAGLDAVGGAGGGGGDGPVTKAVSIAALDHISHVIQEGLAVLQTVEGDQRVEGLLVGHLRTMFRGASGKAVFEVAITIIVAAQNVQRGLAVLGELAVRRRIAVQRAQHDNDLSVGLAGAAEAAVRVLLIE